MQNVSKMLWLLFRLPPVHQVKILKVLAARKKVALVVSALLDLCNVSVKPLSMTLPKDPKQHQSWALMKNMLLAI